MFNHGHNPPNAVVPRPGGNFGLGGGFWWVLNAPQSRTAVAVTALAGIAVFAAIFYTTSRGHLKSPWSGRRKKHALSPQLWRSLFTPDGRLEDGGIKFLKIVQSGGVDPSIREEVWPFLLGVYRLNSSKEERENIRNQNREEYEKLRRRCLRLLKHSNKNSKLKENGEAIKSKDSTNLVKDTDSSAFEKVSSAKDKELLSSEEKGPDVGPSDAPSSALLQGDEDSGQVMSTYASAGDTKSSDSDSSEDPEVINPASFFSEGKEVNDPDMRPEKNIASNRHESENFDTWQRIIRVDAVRANSDWMPFSPSQASVSKEKAHHSAEAVGLSDYDHLEPCRIFHAARLVAILEAYALYDLEIGYCQGMSDLLSPIITFIEEDHEAFWCFVSFMRKARHNFRLDEVGIRRQLNIVSKIIKCKDTHLYRHLETLQAEDCFFVYRMVVVMFRRELTFEQAICLWEVMWADQAAIRAGFSKSAWSSCLSKSAWSSLRQRGAPPTEDLLLYAIAASVLQRRKLIIQKYSSMEEILRECNSMAGHLDVWKLLDDAHQLVVNLHDKVETSF